MISAVVVALIVYTIRQRNMQLAAKLVAAQGSPVIVKKDALKVSSPFAIPLCAVFNYVSYLSIQI